MTNLTIDTTSSSTIDSETPKKMTRSIDDIYTYEKQALDLLRERFKGKEDHPHYKELKELLVDQINDELSDYAHNTRTDRGASNLRARSN